MIEPVFDEFVRAVCTRAQAETLVLYDHHRVQLNGRWGILITYHWLPLEDAPDPLAVLVVFNPSRKHLPGADQARAVVLQHPPAPPAVQAIIGQLHFSP